MVTLTIDEETFAALRKQAAKRGLTVEAWLRETASDLRPGGMNASELSIPDRLERFDQLTKTLERLNVGSGGTLDDSRESIYGDRGL